MTPLRSLVLFGLAAGCANRAASLLGAARAAVAARLPDRARTYDATLAELWSDADPSLPALAEVRAGAK